MMLSGRPRRAPWTKEKQEQGSTILSHAKYGIEAKIKLDAPSEVVWHNCDGTLSGHSLIDLFSNAFPDAENIAKDVNDVLASLLKGNFLVIDGGNTALELKGNIVRTITPNVELQWQLECVRQFLFGVLRVEEAGSIEANIDTLLNKEALIIAKHKDTDGASGNKDCTVINYGGSRGSTSFTGAVNGIISELQLAMPEVKTEMELSGNVIYLKGAHMGWHSNHSRSDGRVYCSWTQHPKTNFFRYEHPLTGEIMTEWEQPGWNIKSFTIPPRPSRFWHCIGASSLRLAIGFRYELEEKHQAKANA